MEIDAETLEERLAGLAATCPDPVAGLFGPDSQLWRWVRERSVVLVGGGRAALLQLAHPAVGEAISASEAAVADPLSRFQRTFDQVYATVFGDLHTALQAARRVHGVHRHVRGTLPDGQPYAANEPDALWWVFATLVEGTVHATTLAHGPPGRAELARFWDDARRWALLFGLTALSPTWVGFMARYHRTALSLRVTPAAARTARALMCPPLAGVARPTFFATNRALTAAMLPEELCAAFGLRRGRRERLALRTLARTLPLAVRATPDALRFVPEYHEARRRLMVGGKPTDPLSRGLDRALMAVLLGEAGQPAAAAG